MDNIVSVGHLLLYKLFLSVNNDHSQIVYREPHPLDYTNSNVRRRRIYESGTG